MAASPSPTNLSSFLVAPNLEQDRSLVEELSFFEQVDRVFAAPSLPNANSRDVLDTKSLSRILESAATLIAGNDVVALYIFITVKGGNYFSRLHVAANIDTASAVDRLNNLLRCLRAFSGEFITTVYVGNLIRMKRTLRRRVDVVRSFGECESHIAFLQLWRREGGTESESEVEVLRTKLVAFRERVESHSRHTELAPLTVKDVTDFNVAAFRVFACSAFPSLRYVNPAVHKCIVKAARYESAMRLLVMWAARSDINRRILENLEVVPVPEDVRNFELRDWEDVVIDHLGKSLSSSSDFDALLRSLSPLLKTYPKEGPFVPIHAELLLTRHLIQNNLVRPGQTITLGVSKSTCFACQVSLDVLTGEPFCMMVKVAGWSGKVEGS
ncbi:hypothetical protein HDV00_006698 [Rhizophlyctis rosea]|nr:hypothetical protein HDV00_006698 [Rhizophlyctis rosea]